MTYVYEKYDQSLFRQRFENVKRVDQFGYDGIDALFDYLEQLAEDIGEPIEVDPIGLCCEYSRYESLEEFQKEYGADEYKSMDDVRDSTAVIDIADCDEGGPFIIQQF